LVEIDSQPRLFVGWRPRARQLIGGRIDLHVDTFDDLRDVARKTLAQLADGEPVAFDYEIQPIAGEEYIRRSLEDLPAVPAAESDADAQDGDDVEDDSAALIKLVTDCDNLVTISADQLSAGEFAMYGIVFPQTSGENIGFIRAVNPARVVKKAAFWGRHSGSLRRTEPPDLMLESDVDLVVTGDELAILRRSAYDRMFSDLDELAAAVPANVAALDVAMPSLPFAEATTECLRQLGAELSSVARRLNRLPRLADLATLSKSTLTNTLTAHGEDPDLWFDPDGQLTLDRARAKEFLDLVEGRWWTADFSNERRRADKFRLR
jgi:hypothetical protein